MNKTLSISIMAMPDRKAGVEDIFRRLGFEVPVAWDCGKGVHETHPRAWSLRDPKAGYHLVLEDDAIPCERFVSRAEGWLAEHPGPTNFFFGERANTRRDCVEGLKRGFYRGPQRWGVAICLPSVVIPAMLDFYPTSKQAQGDARIGEFLRSMNLTMTCPIPSLVDHRPGFSHMHAAPRDQRAYRFVDP